MHPDGYVAILDLKSLEVTVHIDAGRQPQWERRPSFESTLPSGRGSLAHRNSSTHRAPATSRDWQGAEL